MALTGYIEIMINGICTGIGVVCGQYIWNTHVYPRIKKKDKKDNNPLFSGAEAKPLSQTGSVPSASDERIKICEHKNTLQEINHPHKIFCQDCGGIIK